MASSESTKVVIAAMIGNALIAVTKFAAAAFTGSSAMLSEGIHSVVDTGNQVLMLHGLRRSGRPADETHPFGYGRELYFWAFVVAILLFAVGAGVSLYEGWLKIREPHPITDAYVNYIVLGLATVFEAGAWWVAYKAFRRRKGGRSYFQAVRESKDPSVITVLFEDTAAMLGLIAAFIGIALGELLDMPVLDGVASMVIGVILAVTAAVLAYETKGLLIGESASPTIRDGIEAIIDGQRNIIGVNEILTMHMGADDVLLNLSIDFGDDLSANQVEVAISELERRIKSAMPTVKRVFIEAQSRAGHLADAARSDPDGGESEQP